MVESIIPQDQQSMRRGRVLSVFTAKVCLSFFCIRPRKLNIKLIELFYLQEYNATIEFYWDPFLVESNSDLHIVGNPKERILKIDSVAKHAKHWTGVDILVFNTFVWWMSGFTIKS